MMHDIALQACILVAWQISPWAVLYLFMTWSLLESARILNGLCQA